MPQQKFRTIPSLKKQTDGYIGKKSIAFCLHCMFRDIKVR